MESLSNTTMKSDLQKHHGVKYSCEYCVYQTNKKGNLQQHVKSIHDGVKYSCQYCDYKATEKGSLQ